MKVLYAKLCLRPWLLAQDDTSAGGIFGVVDIETGTINAACERWGNQFDVHPDTGKHLISFEVPRSEEVKELVRKATIVLSKVHYVDWNVLWLILDVFLLRAMIKDNGVCSLLSKKALGTKWIKS